MAVALRASEPLFIFDLDNTLYPPEVHLWRLVDARIEEYVRLRLGLHIDDARRMRKEFLREFGTTLKGLMVHHDVPPTEYLDFVHDVPIEEVVPKRDDLKTMLSGLPGKKVVFTNGSEGYAARVLAALGVADQMDAVYGIEFMEYDAKPSQGPYLRLLSATGADPAHSLFCEDVRENLRPARSLGMFTVLVGGDGEDGGEVHAVLRDVCDLPTVLSDFDARRGNGA